MPVPEKITIDGKEYSVKDNPELLALVQEVRKEEKDKLYSTISKNEATIKVLEDEKKKSGELTAKQEEELKKAKDELAVAMAEKKKLEEEIKGKGADGDDDDDDDDDKKKKGKKPQSGLSEEKVAKMISDAVKAEREAGEKKVEELKKSLGDKKASDYRKEQLAKYKDVIIEDFVPENLGTEEEVNKAIESALEKSKKYIRKEVEVDGTKKEMTLAEIETMEKEKGNPNPPTPPTPPVPPTPPDGGSGDLTGKELLSKVEDMTDEEYAKHADAILKEVKSVKYQDQ